MKTNALIVAKNLKRRKAMHSDVVNYQRLFIISVFLLFVYILGHFFDILLPFILSFLIACLLEPAIDFFIVKKGWNKGVSISLVCLLFFGVFFLFFYYLIPLFITDLASMVAKIQFGDFFNKYKDMKSIVEPVAKINPSSAKFLENSMHSMMQFGVKLSQDIFMHIVNSGKILFNFATIILITPLLTFYFVIDMKRIKKSFRDFLPHNYKGEIMHLLNDLTSHLGKYFKGQVAVCFVMATYYVSTLLFLGVEYAVLLGILTGLSLFVPFIGILVSFITVSIITFISIKSFQILIYLSLVYAFGSMLESMLITPKFIGKSLNLHPLWIILGLLFGGSLFGFFGVLFAIPLTAIFAVFVRFFLKKYKNSKIHKY